MQCKTAAPVSQSTAETPPPYAPKPEETDAVSASIEKYFLTWQYTGRKNLKKERLRFIAYLPLVPFVGLGFAFWLEDRAQWRQVAAPDALRKHCFNLTNVVSTPQESEALVAQLKEHGVLKLHSRQRDVISLSALNDVLPRLRLNGSPLTEQQQRGVKRIIELQDYEQQQRSQVRTQITVLTKRLADDISDAKRRYAGRYAEVLKLDATHQTTLQELAAAKSSLDRPCVRST